MRKLENLKLRSDIINGVVCIRISVSDWPELVEYFSMDTVEDFCSRMDSWSQMLRSGPPILPAKQVTNGLPVEGFGSKQ